MIVRILGDRQYRLDDDAFAAANQVDDRVQAAVESGDPDAFGAALRELVAIIREKGEPLGLEEFVGSDAFVPGAETSLEEAREMLDEEGLVPDSR
jgi:hypothetical protein